MVSRTRTRSRSGVEYAVFHWILPPNVYGRLDRTGYPVAWAVGGKYISDMRPAIGFPTDSVVSEAIWGSDRRALDRSVAFASSVFWKKSVGRLGGRRVLLSAENNGKNLPNSRIRKETK